MGRISHDTIFTALTGIWSTAGFLPVPVPAALFSTLSGSLRSAANVDARSMYVPKRGCHISKKMMPRENMSAFSSYLPATHAHAHHAQASREMKGERGECMTLQGGAARRRMLVAPGAGLLLLWRAVQRRAHPRCHTLFRATGVSACATLGSPCATRRRRGAASRSRVKRSGGGGHGASGRLRATPGRGLGQRSGEPKVAQLDVACVRPPPPAHVDTR